MNEKLKAALEQMVRDDRLTCKAAREVAEKLGLKPVDVGKAADELGIRIKDCELGCF
jgi:hypothetical protein